MNQTIRPLLDVNSVIEHGIFIDNASFDLGIRDDTPPSLTKKLVQQTKQPLLEQDYVLAAIINNKSVKIIPGLSNIHAFLVTLYYFKILRLEGFNIEMVFLPPWLIQKCFN